MFQMKQVLLISLLFAATLAENEQFEFDQPTVKFVKKSYQNFATH